MKNSFKNILVVRTDRIGDVVLTLPAVRALKAAYPEANVTVLVAAGMESLVTGLTFVDRVLVADKKGGLGSFFDLMWQLRQRCFDLAIVFHAKERTHFLCALAGIPFRLGFGRAKWGWLLTHAVPDRRAVGHRHEVDICLDLLSVIGIQGGDRSLTMAFQPEAEAWAVTMMARLAPSRRIVALHPDASCATKCWPASSFALLARLLAQEKIKVVIVGGLSAHAAALEILSLSGGVVEDLTGTFSLAQLASFLKAINLLISNDSGPVHMAAAAGTPVLSLFLRSQPGLGPDRWRPLGEQSSFLLNKEGEEIVLDAHSQVISGRRDSLSPEEVFQEALRLMRRGL